MKKTLILLFFILAPLTIYAADSTAVAIVQKGKLKKVTLAYLSDSELSQYLNDASFKVYYLDDMSENYAPAWNTFGDIGDVSIDKSFASVRPTSTCGWFAYMDKINYIRGLEYLNTSNVTNMRWMFLGSTNLLGLDLSNFNTANVTNMNMMFKDCKRLWQIEFGKFNTKNVTDMSSMFEGCSDLQELDLSNFNTASVTDMGSMFHGCTSLWRLGLSNFNTAHVTNMSHMFQGCTYLGDLDLSNACAN